MDPESAAEKAVSVIGFGYDLRNDAGLASCKSGRNGSRLIELDPTRKKDLVVPGGVVLADVYASINCDKGERTRFHSHVLSFNQMSEHFNKEQSLSGKIPCGKFNAEFGFTGQWKKDAASTKNLAFDGWFITLYNIELDRSHVTLSKQVIQDVPSSWDPLALAEFIEKYGTHIVVGVKMGGKDVVHVKQLQKSTIPPSEVQRRLKELADEKFSEDSKAHFRESPQKRKEDEYAVRLDRRSSVVTRTIKDDIMSIYVRKGGIDTGQSHNDWISTVSQSPNVVSMAFVPITSLLSGVHGNGFLIHAVNLYLRYKPQTEELQQFFEFQLPRQWAPAYGEFPLSLKHRQQRSSPSLQFSFMGQKLYVNTMKVDSGSRPVTGLRLYLEGKRSNHLAIHLQHLSTLPNSFRIIPGTHKPLEEPVDRAYFEPVKSSVFSHVWTAPVEHPGACIDDLHVSIVTKAWFEVKKVGVRKVLFLRLGFSSVESAKIRRSEWEGHSSSSRNKSGYLSALLLGTGLNPAWESVEKVDMNSAVYPEGPPLPSKAPKMASFISTVEKVRGPEDLPGYWVVAGAKLCVEDGRISVKVKYTLLIIMTEDSILFM